MTGGRLPAFRQYFPTLVNLRKGSLRDADQKAIIAHMTIPISDTPRENARVLLVDDDVELVDLLSAYLVGDGFRVSVAHEGESAVSAVLREPPDIAVLDVMMPGFSGIEVLRRIRTHSNLPVLMLTARGDQESRILGLELGADDYVAKPCVPRELSARLRAILRRTNGRGDAERAVLETESIVVGKLSLLRAQRQIAWAGQPIALTNAEFNLLEVLILHAGQVVSKSILSEQGLGRPHERYDRSIDVHISSIRRKIPAMPDGRPRIQAVLRKGYQLLVE